jgi:ABC-type transporter MlaC component
MTQIAVARNWSLATPDQQKVLTTEFKTLSKTLQYARISG